MLLMIYLLVMVITIKAQPDDGLAKDRGIRLVGGSSPLKGRVEVYLYDTWGTVCDDSWGIMDANVACKQLGFSPQGAIALSEAAFGEGTGLIHLDDLDCTGQEDRLIECRQVNCHHDEDAGVICMEEVSLMYKGERLANNSVFLVNESTPNQHNNTLLFSCATDNTFCCSQHNANWIYPNGTVVTTRNSSFLQSSELYVVREAQAIVIHIPVNVVPPPGIFHCSIPDSANITKHLYVGIYNNSGGYLEISETFYNKETQTVSCLSNRGPISTVIWKKNDEAIDQQSQRYDFSQQLLDGSTSQYISKLKLVMKTGDDSGLYTCEIGNVNGNNSSSIYVSVCEENLVRVQPVEDSRQFILQLCLDDEWLEIFLVSDKFAVRRSITAPLFNVQLVPTDASINMTWEYTSEMTNVLVSEISCSTSLNNGEIIQHKIQDPLLSNSVNMMSSVIFSELKANTQYNCCVIILNSSCITCPFPTAMTVCESIPTHPLIFPVDAVSALSSTIIISLGSLVGVLVVIFLAMLMALCIAKLAHRSRNHSDIVRRGSAMIRNPIYERTETDSPRYSEGKPQPPPPAALTDHYYTDISLLPQGKEDHKEDESSASAHMYTDIDQLPQRTSVVETSEANNPLYVTGDSLIK